MTFERLNVGGVIHRQPQPPGCLRSQTVHEADIGSPMQSQSFELAGNRGAALVTKYPIYKEDAMMETAFEEYTKRHYESWVAFARNKQSGDDVRPILVSGFDMTKDFAMVAYSYEDTPLEPDLMTAVPMVASTSASMWGMWYTQRLPHTNYGPQECTPLAQTVDTSSLQLEEAETVPDPVRQCVFIRYYTMRRRFGLFPKVIRV